MSRCSANSRLNIGSSRKIGLPAATEVTIKRANGYASSAADAERLKLALVSNLGSAPLTAADRKRIAEHLYGLREWTMQRIAKALSVSTDTVSRDLVNFPIVGKSKKQPKTATNPKGAGRRKGKSKNLGTAAAHHQRRSS
jgi:hypothetical protein